MEKVVTLFNADFEDKISKEKFEAIESSKVNQEFEYLIHWIDPEKIIYSSRRYDKKYIDYLRAKTGHELKTSMNGRVEFYCQDYSDIDEKILLNDKCKTLKFLHNQKLLPSGIKFIKNSEDLSEGGIYKAPFGVSGSGHLTFPKDSKKIIYILEKYGEIVWEPIFNRSKDFSTLVSDGKVIATYENYIDDRFQYKGSYFSPEKIIPAALEEGYFNCVEEILRYTSGYNGILSMDGFMFDADENIYPVCEINARKTMGHAALEIKESYFSEASHFKFLIFRNNFSKATLEKFFFSKENSILMLSPTDNFFSTFVICANSSREMNMVEKKLTSTLFNSL